MAPSLKSARTNDIPSVFNPGKRDGFAATDANPLSEKGPADFPPEKTKSSAVTAVEFLHGRSSFFVDLGFGMQKSWSGSGSEATTVVRIR